MPRSLGPSRRERDARVALYGARAVRRSAVSSSRLRADQAEIASARSNLAIPSGRLESVGSPSATHTSAPFLRDATLGLIRRPRPGRTTPRRPTPWCVWRPRALPSVARSRRPLHRRRAPRTASAAALTNPTALGGRQLRPSSDD